MHKLFFLAGVVLGFLPSSFAQTYQPIGAPDDVVLQLQTEGHASQFRVGELIPIEYSYSARTPGRYIRVSLPNKLEGGRQLEISCSPPPEPVVLNHPLPDSLTFDQMLAAPCGSFGYGGSVGCGDCDWEHPLTTTPLSFRVTLNGYVRFRTEGTYTCEASSADITTAQPDQKDRPALLVKSKPIVLNIVNDPAWSHSAANLYGEAYGKLCRDDDIREHHQLDCFDVSQRITCLDTSDSLATEVKFFDGRSHDWGNGFWEAIQRSSQAQEALRLMAQRMQDSDFEVSTGVIEWLASSELRSEAPDAFEGTSPATYHRQAIDLLRKYVRLLGSNLHKKDTTVLLETEKTYSVLAGQTYCDDRLIPVDEEHQVYVDLQ